MKIVLSPQRRDDELIVVKSGDQLTINNTVYDFSQVSEGDSLPYSAIDSIWLPGDVVRVGGELILTLLLPNPANYSQAQAFPKPLMNVPDGLIAFPAPVLPEGEIYSPPQPDPDATASQGVIDWSQLITKAMKDAQVAAQDLSLAKSELQARSTLAATQIARIQDRIDTLGFGIEIGEATSEDEVELADLAAPLKAWKTYKYALGKVTVQPTWYQAPVWPVEPPIPEIIAAPMMASAETM